MLVLTLVCTLGCLRRGLTLAVLWMPVPCLRRLRLVLLTLLTILTLLILRLRFLLGLLRGFLLASLSGILGKQTLGLLLG